MAAGVVLVGAFGVGRMQTTFCDVVTNAGAPAAEGELDPPKPLGRCEEIGRFEMGSTVVLLFPPGTVAWDVEPGLDVKLGARIGGLKS